MPSTESPRAFLHAKVRVGSCKGPVAYGFHEHVFHADDTPLQKKLAKQKILEWKQRRALGSCPPEWRASIDTGQPVCVRNFRENWVHDRGKPYVYNFRAEKSYPTLTQPTLKDNKFHICWTNLHQEQTPIIVLTFSSNHNNELCQKCSFPVQDDSIQRGFFKRSEELPNHPSLIDAIPWDSGTVLTTHERQQRANNFQAAALQRSKLRSSTAKSAAVSTALAIGENVRAAKREGRAIMTARQKESTKSEHNLVARTSKSQPNRSRSHQVRRTYHSGIWEFNERENLHMWSDTGSFIQDSPGDVVITYNPNSFNLCDWTNP